MSINQQDITAAITRMDEIQTLLAQQEEITSNLQTQITDQTDFLVNTEEEFHLLNEQLMLQLKAAEVEKSRLLSEVEALNLQIESLEKELLEAKEPVTPTPPTPIPDPSIPPLATIPFTINNTMGQDRLAGEYSFTGVPLSDSLNVKDTNQLVVRTSSTGSVIPSDIRATSYWPSGSIQWVQVVFPVSSFAGSIHYDLLVYDEPQTPTSPRIHGTSTNQNVIVVNGIASYEVDVAGVSHKTLSAEGITTTFDGKTSFSPSTILRNIYVEYVGPLVCYVVVEGSTDLAFGTYESVNKDSRNRPISKPAPISFRRRYQFLADNPLITCQESIRWEGSFNGNSYEKYQPDIPTGKRDLNAVLGTLWRETFTLASRPKELTIMAWRDKSMTVVSSPTDSWYLEQKLRPNRLIDSKEKALPPNSSVVVYWGDTSKGNGGLDGSKRDGGLGADGGLMSIQSESGEYTTVAIKDMHLHEPQAIRLANNNIFLDLASDKFWLAHHQGVEVTYAICIQNDTPNLDHIWSQVNRPLRGLCTPQQYNQSGGFDALGGILIPKGDESVLTSTYDLRMSYIANNTLTKMTSYGFQGLMTWGLYPRYWGEWGFNTGEVGSGTGGWDEYPRNASLTDYWCTGKLAVEWAMRSGYPEWIESLSIPAAVRMLHTQIMQATPDDSYFYAGQAPAGYSMYRSDFNSSHQYWENLYLYYLITGDRTVIDIIERGAKKQADFINGKKGVTGRQPMQWIQCFLFLSYCHYEPSKRTFYGSCFDEYVKTALTNHYLTANYRGEKEAVWVQEKVNVSTPSTTPLTSHQLFSLCFYDMEILYHFGLRTNNSPVNGVRPFDAMVSIAKTIIRRGLGGDTTSSKNVETSAWLRVFSFDYDGKGNFTRFEGGVVDNIKTLFPDDKGTLCAFFSRCAWISNDPEIKRVSRGLVNLMFKQVGGRGLPYGKLIGMLMGRLSAAVRIEQMIDERDSTIPRKEE